MFKRNLSLAACVCMAAMVASGQNSYVFQVPGATGLTSQITGFGDNDFTRFVATSSGLVGAFQVLATPNGGKFFIVTPQGIQSSPANSLLSPISAPISGIAGTITGAGITPDGKYLLVMADHFYVVNAATNGVVSTDAGVPGGATPVGFAVAPDSQTAWVLSNVTSGSSVGAVSLNGASSTGQFLFLPFTATSLTLSPLGLLYATFTGDQLYEIDPATLSVTSAGRIQIPSGLFGPLRFTPDGTAAYAVNHNRPLCPACASMFMLNVPFHTAVGWPAFADPNNPPPPFDDVYVASNSQIYAFSSTFPTTKLWDVTPTPFSAAASALGAFPNGPGLPINNIVAAAVSNERPTARYLYLLISDSRIMRVNVSGSNIDSQTSVGLQNGTGLTFTPIPAQTGANTFFTLNRTMTVAPGATSAPLIAQVLDSVGRPVVGVPVCFYTDPNNGLAVNNPSSSTNADGRVQTSIVAPTLAGTYTVTLAAGAGCPSPGNLITTTFTITVGTTTSGPSQISIYAGDGQLLRQQNSTTQTQPLTVKISNTDGTPISGAAVTFAITQGVGLVVAQDSASDDQGLFRANFITGQVDQSRAFQSTVVTASSAFGSVDFIETTQNAGPDEPGQPGTQLLSPENGILTISQGDVVTAGVVAKTTSGHFPQSGVPIPNVGIRLAATGNNNFDQSPAVACQGTSRGDDQGVSRCNVIAFCQTAGTLPQTFGVVAEVGEYHGYLLQVVVTQGKASRLAVVSGNNQTGNPTSSFTLLAKVTDSCGQNVGQVPVTWSVIQGSASLTQVQTVSSGNGGISARVTLGAVAGPVQIQVSSPGITPVTFNLTTQIAVSGLTVLSGGGQSAPVGQPFASPVVFIARDGNLNPVAGLLVNFSATGGASFTPSSGTTNALGLVQTNVTAGSTAGNIIVTATYQALTGTANLTATPPGPQVSISSFKNAASGDVGLTPCGLITVIGSGIAPTVSGVVTPLIPFGPLPFTLAGLSISIQQGSVNVPVPIQAVANSNGVQQVNFQAPCELTAGTATVVVTVNTVSTTVPNVPVLVVQPGIFSFVGSNNKVYGTVIHASDNSLVTPTSLAHRGERLFMFVTGLGQATPTLITNTPGTGSQNVIIPVVVGVKEQGVPVLSARYLGGVIGAYLVEFQIPLDAPLGLDQDLTMAALLNGGVNGFSDYKFGNVLLLPGVAP